MATCPLRTLLACLALAQLTFPALAQEKAPRPNVVYFLADDLGWADVGWHGKELKTPNLDRLAHAGARLEQFYVQPLCSPTRAAFLTGRYPMRYGLQVGVVRPWAQYGLPLEERTLPQALKEAGYVTAIVGKWHLGHFQRDYLPTMRGFHHQYGHYNGALMREIVERAVVVAILVVESAAGGQVGALKVPQVPLAADSREIAGLLESLGNRTFF